MTFESDQCIGDGHDYYTLGAYHTYSPALTLLSITSDTSTSHSNSRVTPELGFRLTHTISLPPFSSNEISELDRETVPPDGEIKITMLNILQRDILCYVEYI